MRTPGVSELSPAPSDKQRHQRAGGFWAGSGRSEEEDGMGLQPPAGLQFGHRTSHKHGHVSHGPGVHSAFPSCSAVRIKAPFPSYRNRGTERLCNLPEVAP